MLNLYIIAGSNGAGKTTLCHTLLPHMLHCREFVNADEIARGLSPFNSENVAVPAARIMLDRVSELLKERGDFAIETTLASRTHLGLVRDAQRLGYHVILVYLWLQTPETAMARVARRVSEGGHNIPGDTIRRRWERGAAYFMRSFIDAVDAWYLYDNSAFPREQIAYGGKEQRPQIINPQKWQTLQRIAYGTGIR